MFETAQLVQCAAQMVPGAVCRTVDEHLGKAGGSSIVTYTSAYAMCAAVATCLGLGRWVLIPVQVGS